MLYPTSLHSRGGAQSLPSHHSRDSLLSYDAKYSKKRRRRIDRAPWLLLVLLCAGIGGAWWSWGAKDATRGRSLLEEPEQLHEFTQEPLDAVHEPQEQHDQAGGAGDTHAESVVGHSWETRQVSAVEDKHLAQMHRGPHDAQVSHGPPPFNEAMHRMYHELPPLDPVGRAMYAGSWQLTQAIYDYAVNQPMAEVISWENPRLAIFRNFLSPPEVQHFINISTPKLTRSEVLSASEGSQAVDTSRTSYGTWPEKDAVVLAVTERIHRLLGIPERFGEDIYVLNYKQGQKYEAHNDHCMDGRTGQNNVADEACRTFLTRAGGPTCGPEAGGPSCGDRVATFILTLKGAPVGGATVFPESDITKRNVGANHPNDHKWYCEHEGVLGVKGNPGDGLLFWDYAPGTGAGTGTYADGSAQPSARPVYAALHSGCPVLPTKDGSLAEKWIATRWIRGAGFDYRGDDLSF